MRNIALPVFLVALFCLSTDARAGDWLQFRGPGGNGVSDEQQLPSEWSADKNVKWKIKVPGVGWACPIVVGDKVIIATAVTDNQRKPARGAGGGGGGGGGGRGRVPTVDYRWEVHCLDRTTGKTLWKQLAVEKKPTIPTHSTNTYASETPVSDGERIYVYFGMTGMFCFDLNGKQVWKKDLGSYAMASGWGTGSSPVLAGDHVIIQCDNEERSFLVALNKKTGEEVWKKTRNERSSWCTPYVWKNKNRTEVVTAGGSRVRSYDPATGKVLWELSVGGGGGGGGERGSRASATPVGDDEQVFFGMGGGRAGPGPLFAVKAGAEGDISLKGGDKANAGVAWSDARGGPSMSSPLLYKGHLYIIGRGGLSCYDAKTGKQVYSERLSGARSFTSSPWAYDGKIFCLDDNGTTFVVQAGKEFKELGKNQLNEMFWSSPAVAGGALYMRGVDHVYCIKQ